MTKQLRVLCVGPALRVRGGISRLIEKIGDHLPPHVSLSVIATYPAYEGEGEPGLGHRLFQVFAYALSLFRVVYSAVFARRAVFHVHVSEMGSALRKGLVCVLLRTLRLKFILHTHSAGTQMFNSWVPAPVRRLMLWGLSGATFVITLTAFWQNYYADKLGLSRDRVLILPNPCVLPATLPDRSRRDSVTLLFLGRIGERKGAFDLIHAYAILPAATRQHTRLILAGDGETERAKKIAAELGCADRVEVPGWVGMEQIARLLEQADIFLLPSRGEGMSVALLEALGAGLAIVTTTAGGTEEFLRDGRNALLVKPGDRDQLAGVMTRLISGGALRLELGRAARATATGFGMDRYIERLVALYESLAGGAAPAPAKTNPGLGNAQ